VPKVLPLDKYLRPNVEYRTDEREALIIEAVGATFADTFYLEIDRKPTGVLHGHLAPDTAGNAKVATLLQLGPLYYAVPPMTPYKVVTTASGYARVKGRKIVLAPGEGVPNEVMARYGTQYSHFLVAYTPTLSFGSATSWPADAEYDILYLTTKTNERVKFTYKILKSIAGFALNPSSVALKAYFDSIPVEDVWDAETEWPGWDLYCIPSVADVNYSREPYDLSGFPFVVEPDNTFRLTVRNVSGSAIALSNASITLYILAEYERVVPGGGGG
jgi:hypothetical protein